MLPRLPAAVPETPVSDLAASAKYYAENLRFRVDWIAEDIGLAGVSRDDCRLFLAGPAFRQNLGTIGPVLNWLNLGSKSEVDQLHQVWSASGAILLAAPESKPFGLHEFIAADPDGNRFRVFYDFATAERQSDASLTSSSAEDRG